MGGEPLPKKYEVYRNGSLLERFELFSDLRKKLEELISEALKVERKLDELPFISLQEYEDDEENLEMYLHTDTYGELDESLIGFLNDKGITDTDVLLALKEWLGIEIKIFQKNLYCFPFNYYVVYEDEEGLFYFEVIDRVENVLTVSTYKNSNEDWGNVETAKRELEIKVDTEKNEYYDYQYIEIEGRRIYANEYYNPHERG